MAKRKRPQLESYESYLERAGGQEVCALCGKAPKNRRLDRDHNHRTGTARGILCHRCNRGLPVWVTPVWLRNAAAYLESYGE